MSKRIFHHIKYRKEELDNYAKDKEACIECISHTIHIGFPAKGLVNFKETINAIILRTKIGTYDSKLNGIILDVRSIKIFGDKYPIHNDAADIHIDLFADFYIFVPQIHAIITGQVKHISKGHLGVNVIGVIIYRVFNVTIKLKKFSNHNIKINSNISLRIISFDIQNQLPCIEGELIENSCGQQGQLQTNKKIVFKDNSDDEFNVDDSGISTTDEIHIVQNNINDVNISSDDEHDNKLKCSASFNSKKLISVKNEIFSITEINDKDDDNNLSNLNNNSIKVVKSKKTNTSIELIKKEISITPNRNESISYDVDDNDSSYINNTNVKMVKKEFPKSNERSDNRNYDKVKSSNIKKTIKAVEKVVPNTSDGIDSSNSNVCGNYPSNISNIMKDEPRQLSEDKLNSTQISVKTETNEDIIVSQEQVSKSAQSKSTIQLKSNFKREDTSTNDDSDDNDSLRNKTKMKQKKTSVKSQNKYRLSKNSSDENLRIKNKIMKKKPKKRVKIPSNQFKNFEVNKKSSTVLLSATNYIELGNEQEENKTKKNDLQYEKLTKLSRKNTITSTAKTTEIQVKNSIKDEIDNVRIKKKKSNILQSAKLGELKKLPNSEYFVTSTTKSPTKKQKNDLAASTTTTTMTTSLLKPIEIIKEKKMKKKKYELDEQISKKKKINLDFHKNIGNLLSMVTENKMGNETITDKSEDVEVLTTGDQYSVQKTSSKNKELITLISNNNLSDSLINYSMLSSPGLSSTKINSSIRKIEKKRKIKKSLIIEKNKLINQLLSNVMK